MSQICFAFLRRRTRSSEFADKEFFVQENRRGNRGIYQSKMKVFFPNFGRKLKHFVKTWENSQKYCTYFWYYYYYRVKG